MNSRRQRAVSTVVTMATVGVLGMSAQPAGSVSGGVPDGSQHPNVACVLGQRSDGTFTGCGTGQLIAPDVVLVAAHEFPVLASLGATRFFVSFEPTVDPRTSELLEPAAIVAAPSFDPTSFSGLDLAVVQLSEPVQGVAPIQLPTAGLLDEMRRSGELRDATLTLVGYGADCTGTIPCPVTLDVTRRVATEAFGSLQRSTFWVLANDAATGRGGPCFGDSGSPHLLPGSMTTIGVTKAVLGNCNTAVPVTRVDTHEARSFLAGFVSVP